MQNSSKLQTDSLIAGDMDKLDIPVFLHRVIDASPAKIIACFNIEATKGQGFRQTFRAVTNLSLNDGLSKLIKVVAKELGGVMKAWACYLLSLHNSNLPSLQLTAEAHALALDQVRSVPPEALIQANSIFTIQTKTELLTEK